MSEAQQPSLFIATPCYGGLMYDGYARSMDATLALCTRNNVTVHRWTSRNESLITRARNTAVHDFLKSPCSHLLFIDADISWPAELPLKMLQTGFPVVAVSYPKKALNWQSIKEAVWRGEDDVSAYQADHVINVRQREVKVENGCVEVLDAGTGFMLISRDAILQLLYAHPEWMYLSDASSSRFQPMFALFDCRIDDKDIADGVGRYLSEDYQFCREWQRVGGRVMLLLDDRLEHTGTFTFKGKLPFRATAPTEYSLPEQNIPQHARIMTGRYEWAADAFARHGKLGLIVNACSGPGYGMPILAAKTEAHVVNVDRSEECERTAKERGWEPFLRIDDIESEEFVEAFDDSELSRMTRGLCCIETVEHLKNPAAFLRTTAMNYSCAVFSVPCVPTKHVNEYHLHDFTYEGFLMVLEAAGWKVVEHAKHTSDVVIAFCVAGDK